MLKFFKKRPRLLLAYIEGYKETLDCSEESLMFFLNKAAMTTDNYYKKIIFDGKVRILGEVFFSLGLIDIRKKIRKKNLKCNFYIFLNMDRINIFYEELKKETSEIIEMLEMSLFTLKDEGMFQVLSLSKT